MQHRALVFGSIGLLFPLSTCTYSGDAVDEEEQMSLEVTSGSHGVLQPTLACVDQISASRFVARFGYTNSGRRRVTVPIGHKNHFSPPPKDRGQPKKFLPGKHDDVFQVLIGPGSIEWRLGTRSITASSESTKCPAGSSIVVSASILPESGPQFASASDAARYIKSVINREELGEAHLVKDSHGRVVGVNATTFSALEDALIIEGPDGELRSLDRFSVVLGGLKGFITVAGRRVCLRDDGCSVCAGGQLDLELGCICPMGTQLRNGDCVFPDLEQPAPPIVKGANRCDGSFCTRNESFGKNLFLYKSLGSETEITSGGMSIERIVCTVVDFRPLRIPGLPSVVGDWLCSCPGMATRVVCGRNARGPDPNLRIGASVSVFVNQGQTTLSLEQRFFARGVTGVADTQPKFANNRNTIESKVTAGLVSELLVACAAGTCPAEGVCTAHNTAAVEVSTGIQRRTTALTGVGTIQPGECVFLLP